MNEQERKVHNDKADENWRFIVNKWEEAKAERNDALKIVEAFKVMKIRMLDHVENYVDHTRGPDSTAIVYASTVEGWVEEMDEILSVKT